jgi:hypothetical protein
LKSNESKKKRVGRALISNSTRSSCWLDGYLNGEMGIFDEFCPEKRLLMLF